MKISFYTFLLLTLAFFFAGEALAQGVVVVEPLTSIGATTNDSAGIGEFINNLYTYGVGLGAILAVLFIMIGGFQYMTSEAVGNKSEARQRIINAVLGLLLLLSPVIIFGVINKDILVFDIELDRLDYGGSSNSGFGSGGGGGSATSSCTDLAWQDIFRNVISPSERVSEHLKPAIEDMSLSQVQRCCTENGCSIEEGDETRNSDGTVGQEFLCDCSLVRMQVSSVAIQYADGSRSNPNRKYGLTSDDFYTGERSLKRAICRAVKENPSSNAAKASVNELYNSGKLRWIIPAAGASEWSGTPPRADEIGAGGAEIEIRASWFNWGDVVCDSSNR